MKRKGIIHLVLAAGLLAGCSSSLESIQLSADKEQGQVHEPIRIEVETTPDDFKLTEDLFHVTNKGKVNVSGSKVTFTAEKEGKYQITASQDGVTSNTLIITVTDDQANDEDAIDRNQDSENSENKEQSYLNEDRQSSSSTDTSNSDTWISWSQSDPLSVDEVISNASLLEKSGQSVWMQGDLPQALTGQGMILYNQNHTATLSLSDPKGLIQFGGGQAVIVGRVTKHGNTVVITVEQAYAN